MKKRNEKTKPTRKMDDKVDSLFLREKSFVAIEVSVYLWKMARIYCVLSK